jgi:hypothetical protein
MSLLDVIGDFQTGTYQVTRGTSNGYDVHGRAIADTTSTFYIIASVQPLTGRDLLVLTEGQRGEETQWLYTSTEMRTRQTAQAPDVVTVNGKPWTLMSVETWVTPDEIFYRCKIARGVVP